MKWPVCLLAAAYGLLSALAALSQRRERERRAPTTLMALGGLVLAAAGAVGLADLSAAPWLAAGGGLAVGAAALWNGVKNGAVHPAHHILRLALSCALVAGLALL